MTISDDVRRERKKLAVWIRLDNFLVRKLKQQEAMEKAAAAKKEAALKKMAAEKAARKKVAKTVMPAWIEKFHRLLQKEAGEKQAYFPYLPSSDREERSWPEAVADTGLATGTGLGIYAARNYPLRFFDFGEPLHSGNIEKLRPFAEGAGQWLGSKGIPHTIVPNRLAPSVPAWRTNSAATTDTTMSLARRLSVKSELLHGVRPGETLEERLIRLNAKYPRGNRIKVDTTSPAVLYHEAGHLANEQTLQKVLGKGIKNRRVVRTLLGLTSAITRSYLPYAGGTAAVLAALSADKDSAAGRYAWIAPWLGYAPKLAGEASASIRGLNALKKLHGPRIALKGLPGLGAAFGSYVAAPLGMSVGAYLTNRWKPNQS
jgi:hypothetical protein